MRAFVFVAFGCLPSLAFAQSQPVPSPEQQVLGQRLMEEFNKNLSCDVDRVRLSARIKELEAQLAKKDEPEKK